MKHYSVAEIDIDNQNWIAAYVNDVTPLVERFGGRYLARTPNAEKIEGKRNMPQIYLIIEWPSREAAIAFYESDEYRPYRASRIAGASSEFVLVKGEDINKLAQMGDVSQ